MIPITTLILISCLYVQTILGVDYYRTPISEHYNPYSEPLVGDRELIEQAVTDLHGIDATPDLNECLSCKSRLQLGKYLSLTRPDLVPDVFTTWCIEAGNDEVQCHMNYGYSSMDYSSSGADFVKVLSLMNTEGLDGDYFCYYHDDNCHILPETPIVDIHKLWPQKPKLYEAPSNSGKSFNVLHVSDFNVQLDYKILSESNCSQSLCCSKHSYNSIKPPSGYDYSAIHEPDSGLSFYASSYSKGHFEKGPYIDQYSTKQPIWSPAHSFGSYYCESPELLINNTLKTIRDFHENHLNFEFAIYTGGAVDHADRIFTSKQTVLESQKTVYSNLHHYLPNFPIYPTIGTRDGFPMNQLPQKGLASTYSTYQWEFDFLADLWLGLDWIDLKASKQVRYSQAGYSIVTDRGLKIISLNSNAWNVKNLYGFWNVLSTDPFDIWQFLIDELIDSEANEQRVWIIAHLPFSHQSLPVPTKMFTSIVERFSPKVIAAIFFGHIQKDEFNILYGGDGCDTKELQNAINFALIGPSISPYSGANPAWRYYSVDEKSFSIVNSFTYYTKLDKTFANEGAEPIWEFEYSARDKLDPNGTWSAERSLDTEFWHGVGERIKDTNLSTTYTQIKYARSPLGKEMIDTEEEECTSDNYCEVTSFTVEARKECMITDDQDNYAEPKRPLDYVPYIRPFNPPSYVFYSDPEYPHDSGNSTVYKKANHKFSEHDDDSSGVTPDEVPIEVTKKSKPQGTDEAPQSSTETPTSEQTGESSSFRDKIRLNNDYIKSELKKRQV